MEKPSKNASLDPDEDGFPDDAELVDRSRSGDLQAFDVLVTRYRGKVYAMIVNMVKNDADAWDLAQDVFVKAWKALPKFEARASFFTWMYRITYNVTCDWIRKRRIESTGEFDEAVSLDAMIASAPTAPKPEPSPDRKLEHSELGERIEAALAELSEEHRAVILLKEVDGLKYHEIAEAVGCSIGTVMSRLFYARKKLQSLLGDVYHPQSEEDPSHG